AAGSPGRDVDGKLVGPWLDRHGLLGGFLELKVLLAAQLLAIDDYGALADHRLGREGPVLIDLREHIFRRPLDIRAVDHDRPIVPELAADLDGALALGLFCGRGNGRCTGEVATTDEEQDECQTADRGSESHLRSPRKSSAQPRTPRASGRINSAG